MKSTRWTLVFLIITISFILTACGGDGVFSMQSAGEEAIVTGVNVVRTVGNPPQYDAVVTGQLPDGCTEIGRTTQRVMGKTIRITMYTRRPEDAMCSMAVQPFEEIVPLDVEGLVAGQYVVEVNGVTTTFNLLEDH